MAVLSARWAAYACRSRKQSLLGWLGVGVREFQTTSGPVDYGLFVGRKLCGMIEAKPEGTTLSGFPSRRLATSQMCRSTSSARKARFGSNM
jgi:hypothetical protein